MYENTSFSRYCIFVFQKLIANILSLKQKFFTLFIERSSFASKRHFANQPLESPFEEYYYGKRSSAAK
jgi:hypothetical protein